MRHFQQPVAGTSLPSTLTDGSKDNVTQLLILKFQEMLREGVKAP